MISTRGRYALRVMADIAEHGRDGYLPLTDIATRQQISEKYLESILADLTRGNLLIGLRGKGGGYKTVKQPSEYTVGEIVRVTEGSLAPVACLKSGVDCPRRAECKTLPIWQGLDRTVAAYLDGITLADVLDGKVEK